MSVVMIESPKDDRKYRTLMENLESLFLLIRCLC
jgi:hypothetical protein